MLKSHYKWKLAVVCELRFESDHKHNHQSSFLSPQHQQTTNNNNNKHEKQNKQLPQITNTNP